MKTRILYLAPEVPALSATFVYNEILQLKSLGYSVVTVSVHPAEAKVTDDISTQIGNVSILYRTPFYRRIAASVKMLFKQPFRFIGALRQLISDMHTLKINRVSVGQLYRFISAADLALIVEKYNIQHIHVHFAHVPTDIAMYASKMTGVGYSVTSHANDIFERGYLLKEKIARSKFFATISDYNMRYLEQFDEHNKVRVVRCGVDESKFQSRKKEKSNGYTIVLGVVGRLVEKKGLHILLEAAAKLPNNDILIEIIGDGPELSRLTEIVERHGLNDRVHLLGKKPHNEVARWLQQIDFFVLPCVQDKNGDQDGIPVSLMEAMLIGIPVISTELSGIPELVIDQKTGYLAKTNDTESLVKTLETALGSEEEKKIAIVNNARKHVLSYFSQKKNAQYLGNLIDE